MYLLTVAVITMCARLVDGQSSQCQKLDDKRDECISLLKCKPLREQLDKPNKTDEDLFLLSNSLTKLHCGSIRVPFLPKVCCPDPNTGQRINSPPPCSTPDGNPGECVNLSSCPHLTNLLQPPVPQEVISFVQSSRCNGPEENSICCGPRAPCSVLVTAFPPDHNSECCGVVRKPFGGHSSNILYQHPWAALIDFELKKGGTKRMCAGTLISARYVLTAAHCTTGKVLETATPIAVRLGEYDLDHNGKDCVFGDKTPSLPMQCNDKPIRIAIETIISYPQQNNGPADQDQNKQNDIVLLRKQDDIALIRLKKAAPYTDFIRPICLPTKNLESSPPDSPLFAVSWYKKGGYEGMKILVEAPFVDQGKCQKIYDIPGRRNIWLRRGHICAGGLEGLGICKGDSGAPLVFENQGRSELIGIVSFAASCYEKDVPDVYTNVYEYIDWIKSQIIA